MTNPLTNADAERGAEEAKLLPERVLEVAAEFEAERAEIERLLHEDKLYTRTLMLPKFIRLMYNLEWALEHLTAAARIREARAGDGPDDGELLPCPFCGAPAERIDIEDGENAGGSCISCTRCQASSNVEFEFKENFISNWNRRVIREAQGGERGEEVMTYDDVLSALKGCSSEHQIMLSVLRSIKEDPFFCKLNASIRQRVRDAIQNYAEPEDRKE